MDFGALPPEINSALMYSGPGPGPMLAAVTAWDQLAMELLSAATYYQSVVSELTTGPWRGPSSVSMAGAAAPQIGWLNAAGAQAEQTAGQARAAVSAYESAFAMTVPPPVIASNRVQLMTLVATNFLGLNTPAIAATEAHYAGMWAQDAAAMYGYAGTSAVAARLSPFTEPPQTVNPAGQTTQAIAVAQATGSSVGTAVAEATPRLLSSLPTALEALASPLAEDPLIELDYILGAVTVIASSTSITGSLTGIMASLTTQAQLVGEGSASAGAALANSVSGGASSSAQFGGAAVSANVGRAAPLGALSVPQSWAANAAPTTGSAALPGGGPVPAATLDPGAPAGLLGGQPLARPGRAARSGGLRMGLRRSVIPRTVCAG
jgi:PPE-repeat protein